MKNILYIFLLFTQVFWAQNAFQEGNKFYQEEKFEDAVNSYESILKSKKESVELYYNLGNAYYKLNKVAPAIYNYEKALLLNPNDVASKNNLRFAQNMTIDEIKPVIEVGFRKTVDDFTLKYTDDEWAKISIGISFVFLLFFIAYYFSENTILKRVFFVGLCLALIALIATVSLAIKSKNLTEANRPAIVFAEITSVKLEPKNSAKDVFTLHEGTKVNVLEDHDNWKKIQLADERTGWISKDAIKELK